MIISNPKTARGIEQKVTLTSEVRISQKALEYKFAAINAKLPVTHDVPDPSVWGIPDEESKPVDGMDSHCINQPGSSKGQGGNTSDENIHIGEH